jgi:capsule biosynthesis phosphatase
MKYVLLCGGIGKRCNNYSLPKPLNYINGKYMIEYIIENIPSNEIYIIYNICLEQYNFEEIIINLFKKKTIHFYKVDYMTRGAVETAYVGMNAFYERNAINENNNNDNHINESIVFIDNDNIHTFPELQSVNNNFIGYGKNYDKTNYSFITILNNRIINIEEKVKISDDYCCGMYGFKTISVFKTYAKQLIEQNFKTKNEFYFSQMYKLMLKNDELILPILVEETNHIGSYDEIMTNFMKYSENKLRICFDLDNTLVTYPTIPNDYSSVKPIPKMIHLLNSLRNKGHEIIIYTARRMKTHNNNVGKVIKDIALVTINTLEKFNIPYDELIFGKPIADIYIDDRAINPYVNDISYFGLFGDKAEFIPNKVANNKYNTIVKNNNIIKKTGPYSFMKGELHFYQNIPNAISHLFPKLINFNKVDSTMEISLDHVEGIPLYFLYKNKLLTEKNIDSLFAILKIFHELDYPITIDKQNVYNNYFKKLENRFNKNDYYFEDAQMIYDSIISDLQKYYSPKVVGIIHGDFWFSNIMLDYNDNYKCIDMKGQVDSILTLNGDMYYDYGKLYQSILGYDLVLNNCSIDNDYISTKKDYFLKKCKTINLNIDYLTAVTASLIFGTITAIEHNDTKQRVWKFIKSL